MTLKFARLFLGFIFISQSALARAPRCEGVFEADSQVRLAAREVLSEHYDLDGASLLQTMVLRFSARQLALHKEPTSVELRERVVRIDRLIQLTARLSRDSSISSSAPSRWVEREVLSRGLEGLMKDHGYDQARTRGILRKIFSHRAVQFLLNPADLPFVADRTLPAPIIERILREGPESARAEINAHYRSQNQNYVDGYRHFAKAYKVVALTLFAVLSWQSYEDTMANINEKKKGQLKQSLDNMDGFLNELDQEFEKRGLYKK
ncbi:hypothetical protein B9G69_011540 [Bdellovibrio sp. SKB1291214]|uniref:hypothetical protein n=1 Tax=Bdellovibrio sp. SKB1291214 TaxID=1732569 RepID=UPI001C3C7239|nr:hypothetical protein [Bdellovibrio sp. SKB1291214]UYL07679.1 hypothetical protein B9G69_011540 [Bdellovibrio sp. SKB1291214]